MMKMTSPTMLKLKLIGSMVSTVRVGCSVGLERSDLGFVK
jgi:hypothetical protein